MGTKLLSVIAIIVLFVGIFTVSTRVVNAEDVGLFCSKKQTITVILKNEANINEAKDKISKIPNIRITKIKSRDEEWSRMVNKMDLPNMENPFKNEFTLKPKKNVNTDEIYNKIKEMDFVESVKVSDSERKEKQK